MQRIFLTLALFFVIVIAYPQQAKVVTAWKYLSDYNEEKDVKSLQSAKEAIDIAAADEATKAEAKTWWYKALIYHSLFEYNLKANTEKLTDISDPNKKTLIGYQTTSTEELQLAYEATNKVKELDTKNKYTPEIAPRQGVFSKHFENKGIACYNAKVYADALPMFEKAIEINTALGIVDSNNTNNAAIVSERSKNYERAKVHYQKLIDMKFGKAATYNSLSNIYLTLNDAESAKSVIEKGLVAYPGDLNLVIAETNFALKSGENQKAIDNLKIAIQKMPNDANLYLVLGNVYDNLANPKDASGNELEKPANYEELLGNAESNYKKAIELKPNYFDALYNLGVLYNNHGVSKSKKADTIIDQAKYSKANADANEEFKRAIPILEKALEVSPTDKGTMFALKQLYSRTEQTEKLNAITEKLKN